MGYDIQMVDKKGNILHIEHFKEGGRYVRGHQGMNEASVSITYNYAWFFYKFVNKEKGIRVIYNQTGKQAKPILQKAIDELCSEGMGNGDCQAEHDYWIPTPSNVTKILRLLKNWCDQHPNGVFNGD